MIAKFWPQAKLNYQLYDDQVPSTFHTYEQFVSFDQN